MDRTEALNVAIEAVKAASQSTIEAGVFFPSDEKVERLEFFAGVLTELRGLRDASPAPADEGREADGPTAGAVLDEVVALLANRAEYDPAALLDEIATVAEDHLCDLRTGDALTWRQREAAAPPAPAVPEERDEAVDEDGAYWIGTPAERPTSRRCQDCGGSGTSWDTLGKITCPTCDGSGCESEAHVLAARPAPVTAAPTEDCARTKANGGHCGHWLDEEQPCCRCGYSDDCDANCPASPVPEPGQGDAATTSGEQEAGPRP